MKQNRVSKRTTSLILLGIGLLLLIAALIAFLASLPFYFHAERTQAEFRTYLTRSGDSGRLYYPRFAFTPKDGHEVILDSNTGTSWQPYAPGEKVGVLYDPDSPADAKLDTFFQLWFPTILITIPALILLLIGTILYWVSTSQKRSSQRHA